MAEVILQKVTHEVNNLYDLQISFKRAFKIYGIWLQTSKHVHMLTHFRNAVPLVWGSLKLAPITESARKQYR